MNFAQVSGGERPCEKRLFRHFEFTSHSLRVRSTQEANLMPSLRDDETRSALIHRLQQLTPTAKTKWGRFDAPRMLCHLNDALACSLGDIKTRSFNRKVLQHFPLKHLFLYVVPFPKNAPTAPEFLSSNPSTFESDRQRLVSLMDRLAATPKGCGPEHPLFGRMTNDEWNVLQRKHIDFHLKQFGC